MPFFSRDLWWAWAVGAGLIAVTLTVVLVLTAGPDSPSEAAEESSEAVLAGDDGRAAELECDEYDGDRLLLMALEIVKPERLDATEEIQTSADGEPKTWSVTLSWKVLQGQPRTVKVDVRLEDGDYVVC